MTAVGSAAQNLLAGTITKYVLLALTLVSGAFLLPFTVHHLGKAQYGLWMLVASVTYYFGLLDLGYGNGLVRHIVEADARGDTRGVNRVASTFVCVYSAIGVVAAAVCGALILHVVPRFPDLSSSDVRTAQIVLAILGARVVLGFPMTVFGAVVNARQGFVRNNLVAIIVVLLNAAVTYVVLESGFGLIMLAAASTAVSAAGYLGYAWNAWRVFPELEIRFHHFNRQDWREVTAFSTYLFIIGIGSQITFNLDNLVVGAYLGTAAVAGYAVAARLSEYQRRVCDQFSGMLFPVVVGLGARRDDAALRTALVDGARVSILLVLGATTCLVGFAQPLVTHWVGAGFEDTVPSLYVLAAVGVLMVSHAAQSNVLLAIGRHRIVAVVWILEGAANLVLSLWLVRRLGAAGVALGTAVPMAIGHLGVLTPTACRAVGLSLRRLGAITVLPALAGVVPAAALCGALRIWLPAATLRGVIAEAAAVGLLYALVVCIVGLDAETRAAYFAHLGAACRAVVPWRGIRPGPGRVELAMDPAPAASSVVHPRSN